MNVSVLPRRSFAVHVGLLCVVVAVLVSAPILETTIFPRGTISGTARKAPLLLVCQLSMAALGACLLVLRPRLTVFHLAAMAIGAAFATIVAGGLLQVGYAPPPIASGWRAFAPPNERHQLGFRGRTIGYSPDDYVVVLLGDSQVEAMSLPFDQMPERILETHLDIPARRTRVFSIGAGAYGTDQEFLALQEYLAKYRADLVVLWQTPSNDIWNNLFNTHMGSRNPKPTFWLDTSGVLQGPSEAMGQPLANSRLVLVSLFQRAFGLPWRDRRWEMSLPLPYQPLDRYEGPVRTEWQERWETNRGEMRYEELDTEKSHMAVLLTPRSKRMQYGLDLTRALALHTEALVRSRGGRLVVLQTDTAGDVSKDEQVYVLNQKYYRTSTRQAKLNWEYSQRWPGYRDRSRDGARLARLAR